MKIETSKLKTVFFGTPHFVIPLLDKLLGNFEVAAVVTAPDKKVGRKQILTASPVKQYLQTHKLDVPAFTPEKPDSEFLNTLKVLSPDIFVVAAYGIIIPNSLLQIPKYGALNLHPSLLPKYRGPSPIQATILHGDITTGVTLIKMDSKVDHGPILTTHRFSLTPQDTFVTVAEKAFSLAAEHLVDDIHAYTKGTLQPQIQDEIQAVYTKIITKEDGFMNNDNPPSPVQIDRMIRAYYPWPTAWTKVRMKNKELRIMKLLPGNMVQIEGKKPLILQQFLNGYPEMKKTIEKLLLVSP